MFSTSDCDYGRGQRLVSQQIAETGQWLQQLCNADFGVAIAHFAGTNG
jgi:hypothetical protein